MNINDYFLDAVCLLKQIISIPSASKEENNLADFLEITLKDKKLLPQRRLRSGRAIPKTWQ